MNNILNKFAKIMENYEIDKKFGQLSVDSICHLFPNEIEKILKYISDLEVDNKRLKHNEKVYKGRMDKALDYIDNALPCIHDDELLEELKEILEGGNDEKKTSREDWEEYAKSKTVTCAVSGTSMEKPKTITQLSKEQLEDMCIHLMHVDNEKTKIIKEQENRIERAIELVENDKLGRTDIPALEFILKIRKDKILEILRGRNNK